MDEGEPPTNSALADLLARAAGGGDPGLHARICAEVLRSKLLVETAPAADPAEGPGLVTRDYSPLVPRRLIIGRAFAVFWSQKRLKFVR